MIPGQILKIEFSCRKPPGRTRVILGMGRFVCEACRADHQLRVIDLVVVACCELCGVLRGDWGWKRVAMTFCHLFTHATAMRRAKLLRHIAELEGDLRRAGRSASPQG